MGGALILLCVLVPTILWCDPRNVFVWATTAVTAGYGVIGYLDDYLKIKLKNSARRARAATSSSASSLIAGAVLAYAFLAQDHVPARLVGHPLQPRHPVRRLLEAPDRRCRPGVYLPFAVLVVVWTSNAVNLTDGLDGLAIGPVMINAGHLPRLGVPRGRHLRHRPRRRSASSSRATSTSRSIASAGELSIYCGAMVGAGIGFLWYNTYPAQVFMGDVGSLALGGGLGMCAVFTKNELLSAVLGGVFFLEAVSVVVQVTSFKLTGQAHLPHGPHPPPLREEGVGRSPRSSSGSGSSPFSWHSSSLSSLKLR